MNNYELGGLFAQREKKTRPNDGKYHDFIMCDISDFGYKSVPMNRIEVMRFIMTGRKIGTIERIAKHDYRIGNKDVFRDTDDI